MEMWSRSGPARRSRRQVGQVALALGALALAAAACNPSSTWTSTLTAVQAKSANKLEVTFSVTNTGDNSSRPSCGVNASIDGGAYQGESVWSPHLHMSPGQTRTVHLTVLVTGHTAHQYTPGDIQIACSSA